MRNRPRGAILVETALFVSATLVFMLGTIQIGVLGFLQLTTDSAAYFDARANVLTVAAGTLVQATHNAFSQIPVADIQPVALPAPTPTIPVDYGYNDPNPIVQGASAVQRHGGASMMQPAQLQTTVNVPGLANILGQSLGVTGTAIEAKWVECGPHFEIANTGCSLANPSANQQTNYFTNGENTPLYFVGFNYMQQCSLQGPWGVYSGSNPNSGTNAFYGVALTSFNGPGSSPPLATDTWGGPCANGNNNGNSSIGFIALGSAEFLDSTNWGDQSAGVSGPCDTSGGTNQSVFEAIAFHQRTFAAIAQYLAANPYQFDVEFQSQEADTVRNFNNQYGYFNSSVGLFSGTSGAGNVATPEAIQSFKNWEGFDDANHYPGNNDYWNTQVQTVYSWDVSVGQGQPPNDPTYTNPTHPEANCT